VQHVAASVSIDRGAAEGGLGKITMELGVPGLVLLAWLATAFYRYVRKLLEATTKLSRPHARLAYGMLAFLIANTASFLVATQVFGDVFVQLMMGWAVGFLLAMPVLAERDVEIRRQRALSRQDQPPFAGRLA
jgi:Sec-independent protein secretion pathway component TatC